jgi:acetyltransferase-like isoleucine patch superfamily enzyme
MSLQLKSFEPLLRLAGCRPDLVRFAPMSRDRVLRTVLLSQTPLVQGLDVAFDETCFLSVPEDWTELPGQVKLAVHAGRKRFSGVHLGVLSTRGQLTVLLGDDHTSLILGTDTNVRGNVQLFGKGRVFIGDRTVMAQARLIVAQGDVVVGDDCQIADEVLIDTSQPPLVTDADSGELINGERRRVMIERQVWIGRRCVLLPGAHVGAGSVLDAGSVVSQAVPGNAWLGGAPAQVRRERITWARDPKR